MALVLLSLPLAAAPPSSKPPRAGFEASLRGGDPAFDKQLRNVEAFRDLARQLPPRQRPRRIVYLASGSHLAPLALCEALPPGEACHLTLTEVDGAVREPIAALLGALSRARAIERLESGGGRSGPLARWTFRLGTHPVALELLVTPPLPGATSPVPARIPDGTDLVVSHDWSGDPLPNLRLVHDLLVAARTRPGPPAPLLMVEDLQRHPYPVDLSFFTPLARTPLPYGHRSSRDGSTGHGGDELGAPLFGGAVVLGFRERWWREASQPDLLSFFDFLLFNEFDSGRRNVLTRGEKTTLPPALLDGWTAFGRRTLAGGDLFRGPVRRDLILAATRIAPSLDSSLKQRLGCRLLHYRAVTGLKGAGRDVSAFLPPGREPAAFEERLLSPDMERLFAEAKANEGLLREEAVSDAESTRQAAALLESDALRPVLVPCPVSFRGDGGGAGGLARILRELEPLLR